MYEQLPSFVREPNPSVYLGDNYLVLDMETTNHEKGSPLDARNSLLLACWKLGQTGETKAAWADEFSQRELAEDLKSVDFVVAWNNKFEYGYLRRMGVELRTI